MADDQREDVEEQAHQHSVAELGTYVHRAHLPDANPRSTAKSDTSTAHFRVFLGQADMFVRTFEDGGLSRSDTWYTYECARDVLVAQLDRIMVRRLDSIERRAADAAAPGDTAEAPAGIEPP